MKTTKKSNHLVHVGPAYVLCMHYEPRFIVFAVRESLRTGSRFVSGDWSTLRETRIAKINYS